MKSKIVLAVLSVILFAACAPTKDEVILVNDQLVNKVKKCSNAESAFYDVCKTFNIASINAELKTFIDVCKTVKAEIAAMEVHKDLDKLKLSAAVLVNEYIKVENDFKEYARLYSIPTDDYTTEDETATAAVAKKMNAEMDAEFKDFQLTQEEFASKYSYTITKSTPTTESEK